MTEANILSHAPDLATADRSEQFADSAKWIILASQENFIWGRCLGSSSNTYKTSVQLDGPHFNCNCPARKKPCKHVLGLLLLFVRQPKHFRQASEAPDWVNTWKNKKIPNSVVASKKSMPDEIAKLDKRLKNRLIRIQRMTAGVEDLEVWLLDLIRQGMASVEEQDYKFWQDLSARMVDTQLSAVGPKIRSLQLLPTTLDDWPEALLQELASLYLLVTGFKQLDQLPELLREQILRVAGITDKKSDILSQTGLMDQWGVIGSFEGVNLDNIAYRKTWLLGRQSKKYALILDYSFNNTGYDQHWQTGHIYSGELVYYPGSYPLRALIKLPDPTGESIESLKGAKTINDFLEIHAKALADNPWLSDFPVCLQNVIPVRTSDGLVLVDAEKKYVSALTRPEETWQLLALSAGHPLTVFGEWTGDALLPLSAVMDGRFIVLGS